MLLACVIDNILSTSKMATNDPVFLGFFALLNSPSTLNPGWRAWETEHTKNYDAWLWSLGHKRNCGLLTLEKQATMANVTQVSLQKMPCEEEQKPPIKSQQQLVSPINEPNWTWILQPQSNLQMMAILADIWLQPCETPELELHRHATPEHLDLIHCNR